jgi:hypothetical protein
VTSLADDKTTRDSDRRVPESHSAVGLLLFRSPDCGVLFS